MKIKEKVLLDAIERSTYGAENVGFCLACGEEHDRCEPDAEHYECEFCEERQVFGAELILIMGEYE